MAIDIQNLTLAIQDGVHVNKHYKLHSIPISTVRIIAPYAVHISAKHSWLPEFKVYCAGAGKITGQILIFWQYKGMLLFPYN